MDTEAPTRSRRKSTMLDLAILGLLHESPMHGYELRKQLSTKIGAIRAAISYGSLYPTLRRLQTAGWLAEAGEMSADDAAVPPLTSRRGRVVYKITAEGKERFQDLLAQVGPEAYEDAAFGVHFAFFARTDVDVRLRILEGRRRKIEERREGFRDVLARAAERLDAYTLELQRHGLDAADREVRWLEELIANERSGRTPPRAGTADPATTTPGQAETAQESENTIKARTGPDDSANT
jgi:DNA-binding PadR family transcriptional regulator